MTLSFLADENISPESAEHLEALGYACHSLRRDGPWRLTDREIVALAKRKVTPSSPTISTLARSTTLRKKARWAFSSCGYASKPWNG
jgi:hypothetical protein